MCIKNLLSSLKLWSFRDLADRKISNCTIKVLTVNDFGILLRVTKLLIIELFFFFFGVKIIELFPNQNK